jgi:drug/metabolite transporter (DMT)-like permease
MNKSALSTALLFMTAVIWGVAFVAQRSGMDYMGAFTFNGARFLLGAASLVPIAALFEKTGKDKARLRHTYKAAVISGLVLFTAAGLQQVGIAITLSAGKAGFITGLYIVLTPVLSGFLGKKTGARVWIGAVFASAGLYLLSVQGGEAGGFGYGDLALVGCAFFWAVQIIVIDRYAGNMPADGKIRRRQAHTCRNRNTCQEKRLASVSEPMSIFPLRFAVTQFAVCGALSFACAFISEDVSPAALLSGYVPVLYSAFLSVGVAYTVQIFGQKHVEPSKAALIFSAESLFGAIGGWLLLGEVLSARAYAGCLLIFAGIIISQLNLKKSR